LKTPEKKKRKREEEQPQPSTKMEMTSRFGMDSCVPCKVGAAVLFDFEKIKQQARLAFEMAPTSLWAHIVRQFMFTYHKTTRMTDFAMDFRIGDLIMDYLVNPGQQFLITSGPTEKPYASLTNNPVKFSIDLAPKKFWRQTADRSDYVLDENKQKILDFTVFMPDRHAGTKLLSTFCRAEGFTPSDHDFTLPAITTVTEDAPLLIPETVCIGNLILGALILEDQLNLLHMFSNPYSTVNATQTRFDCAKKVLPLVLLRRSNEWLITKVDPVTAAMNFEIGNGRSARMVAIHDNNYDKRDHVSAALDLKDAVSAPEVQSTVDWLTQVAKGFESHPNHIFAFVAYVYRRATGQTLNTEDCVSFVLPTDDLKLVPQRSNPFATVLATLMSETNDPCQVRSLLVRSIRNVIGHLQAFHSDIILS
jgi:hypothetical protein